jgi:hypothetical protein
MAPVFKFNPASFSWIAVHPKPKGVIQFIGGAFFGTFPTIFYRYFLQTLFEEGYTIVALPFRFSFRHWTIAIDLLKEQERLCQELTDFTGQDFYKDKASYFWIGHSLGCKYIALLEFLSGEHWREIVASCVEDKAYQKIESIIREAGLESASILDQPSLLIAPDISDTESAIPIRSIAHLLDNLGLGVQPTREQTQCFIKGSQLFNLTALISFDKDDIAGHVPGSPQNDAQNDVSWLLQQLEARKFSALHQQLQGKHLEPLGSKLGRHIVDFNPLDKFMKLLSLRLLEPHTVDFLVQLRKRQQELGK